jgi:hypothetical protein
VCPLTGATKKNRQVRTNMLNMLRVLQKKIVKCALTCLTCCLLKGSPQIE